MRVGIPQQNVVLEDGVGVTAVIPSCLTGEVVRHSSVAGNAVVLQHISALVGKLEDQAVPPSTTGDHSRNDRARRLIADRRHDPVAVHQCRVIAKYNRVRSPDLVSLPVIAVALGVGHRQALHAGVQQIQTILKVVAPYVVVKDPCAHRVRGAEAVPVPRRSGPGTRYTDSCEEPGTLPRIP